MSYDEIIEIIETDERPIVLVPAEASQAEPVDTPERRLIEGLEGEAILVPTTHEDRLALALFLQARHAAKEQRQALIEALSPPRIPSDATLWHIRRNAEARHELLENYGGFDAAEVADRAGSKAKNKAQLASHWAKSGRIFSVTYDNAKLYPGFQFDQDGQPLDVVAPTLDALRRSGMRGWEIALWFDTPNGWLDDATPIDLMVADAERVIDAATQRIGVVA